MSVLEMNNIRYSYDNKRNVLNGINMALDEGKMYAILGQSGCGKTTLLSLLGGLDSPVDGQILYDGQDIEKLGLANHRKNNVAFIFQSYNLIDYLTPKENVALTAKLPPQPILGRVGLTEKECKRNVLKLSGGQQQRVAIARAVVSNPKIILADEPTGNLDSKNGAEVMQLLTELNKEGTTIVMVTHSKHDAGFAHRVINLFDGSVVSSVSEFI